MLMLDFSYNFHKHQQKLWLRRLLQEDDESCEMHFFSLVYWRAYGRISFDP